MFPGSNQRIPEFHTWATIVRGLGAQSYVELGVGSAWSIRDAGVPRIVTVDLLPNGLPSFLHYQGNSQEFTTLMETRALMMDLWKDDTMDVVFIDADHTYEGCKRDFELWYPAARLAVGFHDIRLQQGCDRFWDEVSQLYPSVEIIGRDHESATRWQGNAGDAGRLNAGGIGVIFRT